MNVRLHTPQLKVILIQVVKPDDDGAQECSRPVVQSASTRTSAKLHVQSVFVFTAMDFFFIWKHSITNGCCQGFMINMIVKTCPDRDGAVI